MQQFVHFVHQHCIKDSVSTLVIPATMIPLPCITIILWLSPFDDHAASWMHKQTLRWHVLWLAYLLHILISTQNVPLHSLCTMDVIWKGNICGAHDLQNPFNAH